jgi:hypothetical protein
MIGGFGLTPAGWFPEVIGGIVDIRSLFSRDSIEKPHRLFDEIDLLERGARMITTPF